MTRTEITPDSGYKAFGPWSLGIRAGNLLFVAGTGPLDENGKLVGPGDLGLQTEQTLENVKRVVEAGGASMADIVRTTVWLASFDDYDVYNDVYARYFEPPYPVRSSVQSGLLIPGMLIEIEATAVAPDD